MNRFLNIEVDFQMKSFLIKLYLSSNQTLDYEKQLFSLKKTKEKNEIFLLDSQQFE